eukprot:1137337-Pelagomonas_calceolata.AAC.2
MASIFASIFRFLTSSSRYQNMEILVELPLSIEHRAQPPSCYGALVKHEEGGSHCKALSLMHTATRQA